MTFPLAFLLAAASPAASPDRLMLDAFKSACTRTGDMAEMKADALAAGWQEIAEESDPRIALLARKGREGAGSDASLSGAIFRRSDAGRDLFLIQSRVDSAEGYWGSGCRVYDFAAAAPLDPALLDAWMGRKPTGVEAPAPGLGKRLWEPGWRSGITVEISYVAPGHPLGQSLGLQGNILVASAIGGF